MQATEDKQLQLKFKRYSQTKEIEHFYDRVQWQIGKTYRIRVGYIYDLSKFWIVHKEGELTLFQNYLNKVYTTLTNPPVIPVEDITSKMYCIAYSEGNYCRGIIVNIPHLGSSQTKTVVFLIDFGFIITVPADCLYYLFPKFYQVPRFAIRACLNKIIPNDGDTWKIDVVKRFSDFVTGKVLLCILEVEDTANKILHITLGQVDQNSKVEDIRDVFLSEKLVKSSTVRRIRRGCRKYQQFMPATLCPWLFPTFQALEEGMMPSSVQAAEILKQFKGSETLLKPYYTLIDDSTDTVDSALPKKSEKLELSSDNTSKIDCTALIRSHSGGKRHH